MTVQTFVKRPVEIQAIQFDKTNGAEIARWCSGTVIKDPLERPAYLAIPTLEGTMTAQVGDWIIRGVKGEFYPCKPDIFEATYQLVGAVMD